jgi:hypothetical protein
LAVSASDGAQGHFDGPGALADPDTGHGNDVARFEPLRAGGLRCDGEQSERGGENEQSSDAQRMRASGSAPIASMSSEQD